MDLQPSGKTALEQVPVQALAMALQKRWEEALNLNFHRPGQLADALIDQMTSNKFGYITGTVIPVDGGLRRYQF